MVVVCRHRPDLMAANAEPDEGNAAASAQPQAPLVICSVAGTARDTLMAKLMQEYPTKFGTAIRVV